MEKISIKHILISQNAPEDISRSQYRTLGEKHKLKLTFNKFFDVVGLGVKVFRQARIAHSDFSAVIFTSRYAVDHYFRLANEMRITIPETMKYFCLTEHLANYLQNYIQYRKRRIFFGKGSFVDLLEILMKHKEEKILFPCAEEVTNDNFKILDKIKLKYTKAVMYRSELKDLSNIDLQSFDMVVLFSPMGVKALLASFPNIAQEKNIVFSAFGSIAQQALKDAGIKITVPAPIPAAPSIVMAIERFLTLSSSELEDHMAQVEEDLKKKASRRTVLPVGLSKTSSRKKASTKKTTSTATLKKTPTTAAAKKSSVAAKGAK